MVSRYCSLILLILSITCEGYGQENEEYVAVVADEPVVDIIANRFKPRPKFLEFNVETFANFVVRPSSDIVGDESATVSQNLIRELKLKFPIVLKKNTNVVGGLGYRHEQFKFSDQTDPDYPLFTRFDDKSLNRLSFQLYLKRDLKNEKFLFMYFNSSLNSDRRGFDNLGNQLKLSVTSIYGKKKGPHKQIGFGASFGYDFGEPAAFPVFLLNNDFATNWGYELILPKSAKLRFSPNISNHFFATFELQGASYHLQDSVLANFSALEFRRSSVRLSLTYEREIYDWLWFGMATGYRIPINIFISEPRNRRDDAIIMVDARSAAYFDFSIFLVPPAKLYSKAKGSG